LNGALELNKALLLGGKLVLDLLVLVEIGGLQQRRKRLMSLEIGGTIFEGKI
jgi:hypothetical protein